MPYDYRDLTPTGPTAVRHGSELEAAIPATPKASTLNHAQRALLQVLEEAFGGDPGARVFVQAALRTARRSSLPSEPDAILDFARAHLVGALTEELGPRAVAEFLEKLSEAVGARPGGELSDSGVRPAPAPAAAPTSAAKTPATSQVPTSSGRDFPSSSRRADRSSLVTSSRPDPRSEPGPAMSGSATSSVRSEAPKSSGPRSSRVRTLLVYGDRFTRASLARQLVAAGCDVTVIDSVVDVATVETFPAVAVVDLAAREVDLVLSALLARNPSLRVVALLGSDPQQTEALLEGRVKSYRAVPRTMRAPELYEMLRRLETA